MTARTGSSHLCSGLSSVLPVGRPTELLNGRDNLRWEKQRRKVDTYEALLAQYFEESEEAVVFKTSWSDFIYFQDKIFLLFPNLKIVYLNRLDIEAQAVSLYKAIATGDWHDAPSIRRAEPLSEEEIEKRFDLLRICHAIRSLEQEKQAWENFFFLQKLQPARVCYENFKGDLRHAVVIIASHLDLEQSKTAEVKSEFRVLSDDINESWLMRVRNYRNGEFYKKYAAGELQKA